MDLKSLRYFLAIADEGSISAAAESLNLSQPNISRQMTLLEKELGAKLFERGSRRIVLTEEGMLLRRRAVEILQLADTAVTEIGSAGKDVIGTVRIGCGETDAMRVVARAIRRFSETHPMVRFELHSGNAEDVSDLLERGLVDFGVLIEPTDKTRYDYLSFPTDIRWGALVRRDDPLARLYGVSPSDISGRRVIVSRQNMAANGISGWMGPDFPEPDVVATYNLLFNASIMVGSWPSSSGLRVSMVSVASDSSEPSAKPSPMPVMPAPSATTSSSNTNHALRAVSAGLDAAE